MPTEAQMQPRDKYTMFDRKEKRYRKGIHSMLFLFSRYGMGGYPVLFLELMHDVELPKWTRVSQRVNPPGY